jgi:lipoprotein NlpI/S1-C subfamily serine protease
VGAFVYFEEKPGQALKLALVVVLTVLINVVSAAQAAETVSGSGVIISVKGEILTNDHVVGACQTITVKLTSGNSETAAVVERDERDDLAVVRLTNINNLPASIASFREGIPLRAGDTIVALGYPLSWLLATDASVSVGNVSALAGVADDSRYLQISAPVQRGNSGGPLLDAGGHLVGIVTSKLNALRMARFTGDIPQNVNFAIKAEVARTFLDGKHIAYQTAQSDQQLSPADVGDIARPFTVYIKCERTAGAAVSDRAASTRDEVGACKNSGNAPDYVIEGCSAVIQKNDRAAWAFNNRCYAYSRKGDYDHALADCNEAIRLGPKLAVAYNDRGNAYQAKGDYDRAIADYDQAIVLNPKMAFAYSNRGVVYGAKGDYDRAIADYIEAILLDPKLTAAYNGRGNAYWLKSDFDRAISDYDQVIQLDPSNAGAFNSRGNAYLAKGNFDRATADFNQAIGLDPKLAAAYFDHGIASVYVGSLADALTNFDRSSELDPKNPYTAIWLEIVNKRSNLPSRLAQAIMQIDMTKWPAPVIRLYLGQVEFKALLAAAANANADVKKGQECEANFYGGELALQHGAKDEAAQLFRSARANCPNYFIEWPGAGVELKALGESR